MVITIQINPSAYTLSCSLMSLVRTYFRYCNILSAENSTIGCCRTGSSLPNSNCKNGASMASETREKRIDSRLKRTYNAILPFLSRKYPKIVENRFMNVYKECKVTKFTATKQLRKCKKGNDKNR